MFCTKCGAELPDDSVFCSCCGSQIDEGNAVSQTDANVFSEIGARPQDPPIPSPLPQSQLDPFIPESQLYVSKEEPPVFQDTPTGFGGRQDYDPSPETELLEPSADDYYRQPAQYAAPEKKVKQKKEYKKTSAPKKLLSIFLILVAFLFGFIALLIASARIGLTEDNVRAAYKSGKLSDLTVTTEDGDKTLVEIIQENAVDSSTGKSIGIDAEQIKEILEKPYVKTFVEDTLVDYSSFLVYGKDTYNLNSYSISEFLDSLNRDLKQRTGYEYSKKELDDLLDRINDGDLSFLTPGSEDGTATVEGFDLSSVHLLFSVWLMCICAGIAGVMIILLFVVNRKNPPAAFSFSGTALVVFGGLNLLIAIAGIVFSLIKNIFFVSKAVIYIAMGMGIISLIVLVVGIILLVIKGILSKNAVFIGKKDKTAAAA